MTDWVDFTDRQFRLNRIHADTLQARINKSLSVSMSVAAWEAIGKPERVSFKTSQSPRAIAILPAQKGAFSVLVLARDKTGNVSTVNMSAMGLLKAMKVDIDTLPQKYPVTIEDGMVVINLDTNA